MAWFLFIGDMLVMLFAAGLFFGGLFQAFGHGLDVLAGGAGWLLALCWRCGSR